MKNSYETWQNALPEEIGFWREIIAGTFPEQAWCEDMRRRAQGETSMPEQLLPYVPANGRVLDVGAGPVSILGLKNAPAGVELIAVDPLADAYAQLFAEFGVHPVNVTRKLEAEQLSTAGLGLFDLVYSRNALDHCHDPVRAIAEMIKVCNPSGMVFFEGSINESVQQHGAGLHQWNFMPLDNGDLIVWQPNNRATSVRQALSSGYQITAQGAGNDRHDWFTVKIARNQPLGDS